MYLLYHPVSSRQLQKRSGWNVFLQQAEYMASQGVKELILVAQETTVYGTGSLRQRKHFIILLKEALSDQGNPLDPCALLLSGGDL